MTLSIPSVNLIERVCHLTNKIYRDVLCITTQGRSRISYITIGGLDHVRVSTSSTSQYRITLSRDLLDWILWESGILCSFTDFITTPELSGPLYISPDIYHSQITEYSLKEFLYKCKGAPGSECRTYTRLVSPAIGREKKKWNPLFFDKIRYLEFN